MIDALMLALRGLITLSLLAFLGLAFYFIWQDLARSAEHSAALNLPAASLVVIHCQTGGLRNDERFMLGRITSIGRSATNSIVIEDPAVSSRHASIFWQDGRFWIEDFSSRNGTLLNSIRIEGRSPLVDGDVITTGGTQFRVRMDTVTVSQGEGADE